MAIGMRAARWGALVAFLGAGTVSAEEPPRADPTEVRILDVSVLTMGRTNHIPVRGPLGASPDQVNDEERPIFGAEGEEPVKPYGHLDELIELAKQSAPPGAWDREGLSFEAQGRGTIVLKGPKSLLDATETFLSSLEKDALAWVTVDALALSGANAVVGGDLAAALAKGDTRILAAVRTAGFSTQRVNGFSGGHRAFLADQDVEVAEDASTADPIVSVLPDGLCLDVRSVVVGPAVQVDARLWLARVESMDPRAEASGELEIPTVAVSSAEAPLLRLKPGEWTVLAGTADVSFALRATVEPGLSRGPTAALPSAVSSSEGPLSLHLVPAHVLAQMPRHTRGPDVMLNPSAYTPPEPPELPEPAPIFPLDSLVELVKSTIDPPSWDREGAGVEARNDVLLVRSDEGHAKAVEAVVRHLVERRARAYRVTATVTSYPRLSVPEVLEPAAADAGGPRPAAAREVRPAPADSARAEARASVRLLSGGRAGTFEGRSRSYVADYEVEIAQKAAIGNPVVKSVLEGLMLDVAASAAGGGTALACEVRCDRSTWRGSRPVHTRHGTIDMPDLGVVRFRGGCVIPLGGTRVLSVWTEGARTFALSLRVDAE